MSAPSTSAPAAPRSRSPAASTTPARSSTTERCGAGATTPGAKSGTGRPRRSATTRRPAVSAWSTSAWAAPQPPSPPATATRARSSTTERCVVGGSNDDAQLGYGNTDDIGDNETPNAAGPVNLGVGRTAIAIAASDVHTCVILDTGAVKCWGDGGSGKLGYGNTATIGDDETPNTVGTVNLGSGRTRSRSRPAASTRARSSTTGRCAVGATDPEGTRATATR